jgi:hypothetical protein
MPRTYELLPTGTWNFDGNGHLGQLVIESVDGQGRVSGTVYGEPIRGWWSKDDRRLSFLRISNPNDPTSIQTFTGYGWDEPSEQQPSPTQFRRLEYYLAGYFETFAGGGGSALRPSYGWRADITLDVELTVEPRSGTASPLGG